MVCSKNDIRIFYVEPELFNRYDDAIPSKFKFMIRSLAEEGIDNLTFKGTPVVPFRGIIDKSVNFGHPDQSVQRPYKLMHERFVKTIEMYEKLSINKI